MSYFKVSILSTIRFLRLSILPTPMSALISLTSSGRSSLTTCKTHHAIIQRQQVKVFHPSFLMSSGQSSSKNCKMRDTRSDHSKTAVQGLPTSSFIFISAPSQAPIEAHSQPARHTKRSFKSTRSRSSISSSAPLQAPIDHLNRPAAHTKRSFKKLPGLVPHFSSFKALDASNHQPARNAWPFFRNRRSRNTDLHATCL